MAQRAYRQRKELAIEALKQRVSELERLNEKIGQEFVNFTDLILQQECLKDFPEIAEHIKQTTLSMLLSARDAEEEDPGDSYKEQTHPGDGVEENSSTSMSRTSSNSHPPRPSTRCTSASLGSERIGRKDLFAYDSTVQPSYAASLDPTTTSWANSLEPPHLENAGLSISAPDAQAEYDLANCVLAGSSYASSLQPPRSYAAYENTFGRRLHRASQEAGFLLASMKHPPPSWYLKTFGFCLHLETRQEICHRMGEAVRQAQDSTLNNWRYPFTNLGGAGLFYPDIKNSMPDGSQAGGELPVGNRSLQHEAYIPSELTGFSMGPFSRAVEEVRDLRLNPQLRMLDPNFQGDFFDSDEIEICLRGHGVTIPPNKDFVTAQIDMAIFQSDQDATPVDFLANQRGGSSMPLPIQLTEPTPAWDSLKPSQGRKTKVMVDVERLISCRLEPLIIQQDNRLIV